MFERGTGKYSMDLANTIASRQQTRRVRRLFGRLAQDRQGATAIEFGLVVGPFLLFVLGIMALGLQFFTINSLDHATEVASRRVRTGQAQLANMTNTDFKNLVCTEAGSFIQDDCSDKVKVHIQSDTVWANITPIQCAAGGVLTPESGNGTDLLATKSGTAGAVVLVTICYDWTLPVNFSYLQYMLMKPTDGITLTSGGSMVQSVATFRTEPYQ